MLAPAFSGLTAIATYFFTKEMKDSNAGLLAAIFMGIAPGYISRSVAGSYDNEAIAITLLMATFYFWIKSMKLGSVFYATLTALFYFYMVSAWGGYVFITNLIPLHVFVLILMGRYNKKLYTAYTTWYALGTLASMQIPFVGFLPIRSNDHMAALGVFGLLQLVGVGNYVKTQVPSRQFKSFLVVSLTLVFILGIGALFGLTAMGWIAPWTGRFYSLWDTNYAKIHIPIIASVSEHQPTAWPAFFFDTSMLIWLFPAGIYMCFQDLRDEHVFVIIYGVLCSYFAGVMVRLMLTLTPIVCVSAAIALSKLFDVYLNVVDLFAKEAEEEVTTEGKSKKQTKQSGKAFPAAALISRVIVLLSFTFYLFYFVLHCTWVTSNAYSSPSVVLATNNPDGSQHIIDDYREAYYWLRMNTAEDAKVMAWWDYGYQIGGMADRTTLVDNNTWNNTHIATVGKAMASPENVSYKIFKQHDVDYVLIIFGGLLGYSGDDINKFLWMVRISEGIWPEEIRERDYFTERGEYKVDKDASKAMKESLMYKLSYYRYAELFGGRDASDRVRQQQIPADEPPQLSTVEEVFTSENWIVRIYKLKMSKLFDIEHHLVFYRSYHFNHVNVAIHLVCIPIILLSAITMLSPTNILGTTQPYVNLGSALAIGYGTFYALLDWKLGIPSFGLLATYSFLIKRFYLTLSDSTAITTGDFVKYAIAAHVFAWLAQFYGHGVHEKRAPALLDNLLQALVLAPFFVVFELAFFLGFRSELKKSMDEKALLNIKKFKQKQASTKKSE
ncbi:Dolichyl-diphosphooligosaccharide--protein glycosyltransferase subunit STT3 [Spathaspora sp. JA1]|nr:Dolichyl-diphosphooligosaccharide--protein glycosyltransferase subunit STT3 [Spathaspora sp. JA1]